jgi:hypothetical protein
MRGGALELPFAAPVICRMSFRTGGQSVAGGHIARIIHRLSEENSETLFEAGRLENELCISRQNH